MAIGIDYKATTTFDRESGAVEDATPTIPLPLPGVHGTNCGEPTSAHDDPWRLARPTGYGIVEEAEAILVGADALLDSGAAVRKLHDRSGLTWEQIAALFAVSRRSVHHWVAGGVMNGPNAERLRKLTEEISLIPGEPSAVRLKLLTPDEKGNSIYFYLKLEAYSPTLAPEGFTVDELIGGKRNGEITARGRVVSKFNHQKGKSTIRP